MRIHTRQVIAVVRKLADHFGRERVVVRSEYHVQVVFEEGKAHQVWVPECGDLKWRLHGQRSTQEGTLHTLIKQLNRYAPEETDLGEMNTALALAKSVTDASRKAKQAGLTEAIYCDAGFKGGNARASVIAIIGNKIEATSWTFPCFDSTEAEKAAIRGALYKYLQESCPIFSDCQGAVDCLSLYSSRVRKIGRENNKAADAIGNMRDKP